MVENGCAVMKKSKNGQFRLECFQHQTVDCIVSYITPLKLTEIIPNAVKQ